MSQTLTDLLSTLTNCLFCFPSTPSLHINNRTFRMLRLLGEGGFSYVYLVQDNSTSQLYALKKIRCPFGQESVAQALKEVEAYSLFSGSPDADYVIHAVDHQVKDEGGKVSGIGADNGAQKTVYILLPYFRRGNLQDAINANLVNHTRFGEKRLLRLIHSACRGLRALHKYRIPSPADPNAASSANAAREARGVRQEAADADADLRRQAKQKRPPTMSASAHNDADESEEQSAPLMNPQSEVMASQAGKAAGAEHSYAHRDIKPANIMLADDPSGHSVLMDFGSLAPSPVPITSRSQALAVQDQAAEHSTMPYRAPELFDVKTESVIDTKVDIWSMGCTIYACCVGKSPFEARSDETGGSLSICVLGGDWRWPDEAGPKPKRQGTGISQAGDGSQGPVNGAATPESRKYPSEPVREIVKRCLAVEPSERPNVDELMAMIEGAIHGLPDDADDELDHDP